MSRAHWKSCVSSGLCLGSWTLMRMRQTPSLLQYARCLSKLPLSSSCPKCSFVIAIRHHHLIS